MCSVNKTGLGLDVSEPVWLHRTDGMLEVHVHVMVDKTLLLAPEVWVVNVIIPGHILIPFVPTNGVILLAVHCPIVRHGCPFSPWRS